MTSHLGYGHLGQKEYDGGWRIQRQQQGPRSVVLLERVGELLSAVSDAGGESRHENDLAALIKGNPHLSPARSIIKELLAESRPLQFHPQGLGPEGRLLAFGYISVGGTASPKDKPIGIIASLGGANGETLRLITVGGASRRFGQWTDNTEPIRQLCFARNPGGIGALLAVRLSSRTVIFRPHRVEAGMAIDPSPIVSLPVSNTGGFPHSDICFDPTDQRRFAIIDTDGNWTVFMLTGKRSRQGLSYNVKKTYQGTLELEKAPLVEDYTESQEELQPVRDFSWCRILWVQDILVVFARQQVLALTFEPYASPVRLRLPRSGREEFNILDAQSHPTEREMLFVVTSLRILLVRIRRSSESKSIETITTVSLECITSWTHYRDRYDDTLNLSVVPLISRVSIVLHSTATGVMTLHQLSANDKVSGVPISPCDPVQLQHKQSTKEKSKSRSLLVLSSAAILTSAIRSQSRGQGGARSMALELFELRHDCATEQFCAFRSSGAARDSSEISGGETTEDEAEAECLDPWTVPNDWVYQRVLGTYQSSDVEPESFEADLDTVLSGLEEVGLGPEEAPSQQAGSLFEIGNSGIRNIDMERVDDDLEELRTCMGPDAIRVVPAALFANSQTLSPGEDGSSLSVLSAYNDILTKRIAPIPPLTPNKSRTRLSDIAARVATELVLSIIIRLRPALGPSAMEETQGTMLFQSTVSGAAESTTEPEDETWVTPSAVADEDVIHSPPGTPGPYSSQFDSLSMPTMLEPTPSISSGIYAFSRGLNPADTAYQRLSRYTTFSQAPDALPNHMARILFHWVTGEDPDAYNWTETCRRIEHGSERAIARRALRQAQRRLRDERRNARLRDRVSGRSSRATSVSSVEGASMVTSRSEGLGLRSTPLSMVRRGSEMEMQMQDEEMDDSQSQSQSQSRGRSQGHSQGHGMGMQIERAALGARPVAKRAKVAKNRRAGF